jgi:hypothetical protein
MTRISYVAAILIASLKISIASAEVLSTEEKDFAVLSTAGIIIASECDAKIVPDALVKYADRTGVNFDVLRAAMMATLHLQNDEPYERADLIPEVTKAINWVTKISRTT